ncbi:MAG: GTPase HflX [Candidatus Firestonebacteria bacterium]
MELAILSGLTTESQDSYQEIEELAKTASAKIACKIIQNKSVPDSAFYIGAGKVYEIKEQCKRLNINLVIFNHNLKPNQQRNLEKIIERKIIDRTALILDIFAKHAKTNEGKIQVELAQLIHLLPRLHGKGVELSQLGGGIGTRGPGEKKLEIDRRRIRHRIMFLNRELKHVIKHRGLIRESRLRKGYFTISIVGYTNSGKSTLLNTLTKSNVLVENKLFSTLDPTTRKLILPNKEGILLTDTVGFIRNLPSELSSAFRATLEEIKYANIILTVLDISKQDINVQQDTVFKELKSLQVLEKPVLTVLNKIDLIDDIQIKRICNLVPEGICVSALKGYNLENLINKIYFIYKDLLTKT